MGLTSISTPQALLKICLECILLRVLRRLVNKQSLGMQFLKSVAKTCPIIRQFRNSLRFCSNEIDKQYFATVDHLETPTDKTPPVIEEQKTIDILDENGENFIDEHYFRGQVKSNHTFEQKAIEIEEKVEDLNYFDEQFFGPAAAKK